MPTKHDTYVDELIEIIESDYDYVYRNVPLFSEKRRMVAEIDVMAIKDDVCDIYEVKCSHRITKAKKQLKRIRKVLSHMPIRKSFFFCGDSGLLLDL